MNSTTHLPAPDANVFGLLAGFGRRVSVATLSGIAGASGVAAFAASLGRHTSWAVPAACYVVWSFASWGVLFHTGKPRSRAARALELLLAGSGSVVAMILFGGMFFWALGPRWVL